VRFIFTYLLRLEFFGVCFTSDVGSVRSLHTCAPQFGLNAMWPWLWLWLCTWALSVNFWRKSLLFFICWHSWSLWFFFMFRSSRSYFSKQLDMFTSTTMATFTQSKSSPILQLLLSTPAVNSHYKYRIFFSSKNTANTFLFSYFFFYSSSPYSGQLSLRVWSLWPQVHMFRGSLC